MYAEGEECPIESVVRVAAAPIARGAWTARQYVSHLFGEPDITAYVERLTAQSQAVVDGDLSALERMLVTQAGTLDAMFNHMATKAYSAAHPPQQEAFMRQALKAQQQCANTVKVLGELKSPRQVAFIKQQNNAAGHQQVNNGVAPSTVPRAHEEKPIESNELLVNDNGTQTLDTGAESGTGRGNQALEAVGAVHRAAE
ncbi:hypothetical protein A6V36_24270 [Paraburkholderia ginsengiterrae]|uniref:Uncharacterized protein n=1 Tax=Paraburkholderia ginsengiterrae TaxID=1462993 RepID=A0A1A9N9I8_9BURK|nr:hypothetical protein A6V36_24270 [Paraburkholderia ginsengiterrae]OAJ62942.1 hypothetical protein A6V37_22050 [Paraburkholderia ginsengiterrae]